MKRIVLFALLVLAPLSVSAQDEPTPSPEVTVTEAVTEVVGLPPVEPTAVETALPPENPRGSLTLADVMPYIVPIAIIGMLAFFVLLGGVVYALWKSVPAALKPIAYPMLQSGSTALLDMADNYAKTTESKADDELVADLRAEINAKLKALYDEMQAQRLETAKILAATAKHVTPMG